MVVLGDMGVTTTSGGDTMCSIGRCLVGFLVTLLLGGCFESLQTTSFQEWSGKVCGLKVAMKG